MSTIKIKVTSVSLSKKGTVWLQAKILEGETPKTDSVFECEEQEPKELEEPKDK